MVYAYNSTARHNTARVVPLCCVYLRFELGIFHFTIFKPYFLTYYFKLRGLATDYLRELPKLAPLEKNLCFLCTFCGWASIPIFPTFHCYSQGYAILMWHAILCLTLEQNQHLPCRLCHLKVKIRPLLKSVRLSLLRHRCDEFNAPVLGSSRTI